MKTLLAFAACALSAQVLPPDSNPVRMGHLHIVSAHPDLEQKLWAEVIGAQLVKAPQFDIYKISGTLVVVSKGTPVGGTEDSVVRHIGLKVRDLPATVAKAEAAGFTVLTRNPRQAMLEIADGINVELTSDPEMAVPVANHHIHIFTLDTNETRNWYADLFGAKPRMRGPFAAADLPGVNLSFSKAPNTLAGTKGRALDHIGFEVKDLEAFTKRLEESGVTLAVPYRQVPSLGIAIAFVSDPWGTYIELTEGLDKIQ